MTALALALALPLASGLLAFLLRRLPAVGGGLAVATGAACLALVRPLAPAPTAALDLPLDVTLEWTPVSRLLVMALWAALVLVGLLELARPGRSFVVPATLLGFGSAAVALVVQPLTVAVLLLQIAGLLLIFPALQGPDQRPWGSLGYLSVLVLSGAAALVALWLADFYMLNPDDATARAAAMLVALAVGLPLALAPLHIWLPRLAEAAPGQVLAWVGLVGQTSAVGLLMRLLGQHDWLLGVTPLIQALVLGGLLSMTLGGWLALAAPSPRHWLAHGLIYSLGLAAVGLGLFTRQAAEGAALTLTARALALVLATAGFRAVPPAPPRWDDVRGLADARPAAAVALAVAGAALAGTPPLAGFPGAWLVYRAAYGAAPLLAYLMLPGTVLVGLSVVRVLALMVRPAASAPAWPPASWPLAGVIGALVIASLLLGWLPQVALAPVSAALATLPFLP